MTIPLVVTALAVAGFIALAVRLSRRQSAVKKEAIAQLAKEKEQIAAFDIHALVRAEVDDLGLRDVAGAEGVNDSVLLKTWNQSRDVVDGCSSRDMLRYVVRDGVDPSVALDDDVELVCADSAPSSTPEPASPSGRAESNPVGDPPNDDRASGEANAED